MSTPRLATLILGLAAALLTACGNATEEPTSAAVATSAPATASPSPTSGKPGDPAGQRACDAVKAATVNGDSFKPEPMRAAAADGMRSINISVRIGSALLDDRAKLAAAAKGASDEAAMTLKLGTAALDLETTCITNGYYPR